MIRFAAKYGCSKVYTDLYQLAADAEIDAVYIASPNACHEIQSEILLKGQKHVILEIVFMHHKSEICIYKGSTERYNLVNL